MISSSVLKLKNSKKFFLKKSLSSLTVLFKHVGVSNRSFIFPVFLNILSSLFQVASIGLTIPVLQGLLSDDLSTLYEHKVFSHLLKYFPSIIAEDHKQTVLNFIILVFCTVFLKQLLDYFARLSLIFKTRDVVNKIRQSIFQRYLKFGKLFYEQSNLGHLKVCLVGYPDRIGHSVVLFQNFLATSTEIFFTIILLFLISFRVSVILFCVIAVLFFLIQGFKSFTRKQSLLRGELHSKLNKKSFNVLSCIPLVKDYSSEEKELKAFAAKSDSLENTERKLHVLEGLYQPIEEMLAVIFLFGLLYFTLDTLSVSDRATTVATLIPVLYLVRRILSGTGFLGKTVIQISALSGFIEPILDILSADADKFIFKDKGKEFEGIDRGIKISKLNFSYPDGTNVFRDLSLEIKRGEVVALVGPSGSGKSTLVSILLKHYEAPSGTVFFDEADINDFSRKSFAKYVSVVHQDSMLFNDSIRNNLLYGLDPLPSEQEIENVLSKVQLDSVVEKHPQGLDAVVGDRGIQLSGGERQRLAIARAILKDSPIVFLDEATSSLDAETEHLVQQSIYHLIQNKTVVMIAHRLATIRKVSRVILLEDSKIKEEGSYDELVNLRGTFYNYIQKQTLL